MIELDWQLTIAARSEKPRYVILGSQELSEKQRIFNCAIFNTFNYRNAYIQLNNERHPEHVSFYTTLQDVC